MLLVHILLPRCAVADVSAAAAWDRSGIGWIFGNRRGGDGKGREAVGVGAGSRWSGGANW